MKQKQNDRFRLLFIISIFALTLGASYFLSSDNNNSSSANILNEQKTLNIEIIRDAVKNKDISTLNNFTEINGSKNFINDLQRQKSIFDLSAEKLPNGFMVSFSGLSSGNSLHPYFGFFEEKNGEIANIYWSENSSAEIVKIEENKIYLKNTGVYAWNTQNEWIDYMNGNNITFIANKKYINPGEIGIFEADYSEEDDLLIQNSSHQYLIEIN